jgi:hypothetical protein
LDEKQNCLSKAGKNILETNMPLWGLKKKRGGVLEPEWVTSASGLARWYYLMTKDII